MNRIRFAPAIRPVLLGIALASAATAAMAASKTLDRTFDVSAGGVLTVDAEGAEISVSGGDSSKVVVHIESRGSQDELDELNLSAAQSSDGVKVEARRPHRGGFHWGSWNLETHIDVTVPRSYRVDGRTSGGDIRLENVSGPSQMRTSGGNVDVKNVKGTFEGHTSGGNVRIESMEGSVNAHTSGGDVVIARVKGDVDAHTSGGDVRVTAVDGRINAGTSGGNVRCELTGQNRGITATTSGGSLWLTLPKNATGTIDAQAGGGHIDSDFPISTTHWSQHRLNGQINDDSEEIVLRTSGGSITLNTAR